MNDPRKPTKRGIAERAERARLLKEFRELKEMLVENTALLRALAAKGPFGGRDG